MADNRQKREEWQALIADIRKAVESKNSGNVVDTKLIEEMLEKRLAKDRGIERKGRFAVAEETSESAEMDDMLFSKAYDGDASVQEFRKLNDDCVILSELLDCDPRSLKSFKKLRAVKNNGSSELRKAMDTATAGEGLEWVPTGMSRDVIDIVHLDLKVADLFTEIQMPTASFDIPGKNSESSMKLTPQSTGDGTDAKPTASTPGSRKVTLTAIKLMGRVLVSEELVEDNIVPTLPLIKADMADALKRSWEVAILDGDTTASHMDADVTDAEDPKKSWNGLRKLTRTADNVSLATLNIDNVRAMRGKMGKYGALLGSLAYIASVKGQIKLMGMAELQTVDKYGPNASILTGEVGRIDNIPVVLSEWLRDDLNANGVNDSTTNAKGILLLVFRPGFVRGEHRGVTVKYFNDIERDQNILVTSWRGDFKARYNTSTQPIAVKGVNLTV